MTQQTCSRCKAAVHEGTHLCARCTDRFAEYADTIAGLWGDIETLRTRQTRHGEPTRGSIGKTRPLGMDLRFAPDGRATKTEAAIRNAVTTWARVALDTWPNLTAPADNVPAVIAWLTGIRTAIAGQPWAGELYADLRDCAHSLSRLLDNPPERWYAGKCSVPGEDDQDCKVDLYANTESGTIACPGCGAEHDVGSRRSYLLEQAKDYLVTATEAAGALLAWTSDTGTTEEKLVDRIRRWAAPEHKRITARGSTMVSGRERALYRLGDIQALMVADAQRLQKRWIKP